MGAEFVTSMRLLLVVTCASAFVAPTAPQRSTCASAFVAPTAPQRSTALRGWFDGKDDAKNDDWKDEMMREQKEILSRRQDKDKTRDYFKKVDEKRVQAQKEQVDRWAFQRDPTADPLIAWKKMRKEGKIGDLKTGLGVDGEKREGGIPLPLPSFGVGGEAGVGGQYDNGERFDLRLPFVDQGWVDERDSITSGGASWFSKLGSGGAKKPAAKKSAPA